MAEWDDVDKATKLYDMHTGFLIAVVGPEAATHRLPVEVMEIQREDGTKVWVQKGIMADEKVLGHAGIKFNPLIGDIVCSKVANGNSVTKVCREDGMPTYGTVCRWRRESPEFDKALDQALQDKADFLTDEALEVAKDLVDNDRKKMVDVAATTLLTDQYWKKATADKPRKYSPKLTHSGDPDNPISIVIETGIRRKGDSGFNIDETEKIKNASTNASTNVIDLVPKLGGPDGGKGA